VVAGREYPHWTESVAQCAWGMLRLESAVSYADFRTTDGQPMIAKNSLDNQWTTWRKIIKPLFYIDMLERVVGIEPTSLAWKARVIAFIRYPQAINF
jgi:hypothetical protein